MDLYTIENIKKEFDVISSVKGSTVQSRNALRDVVAGFRTIIGGEVKEYTEMLNTSRKIAEENMIKEAEELGADAIIGLRYTTNSIMDGCTEILVYGTAIKYVE